MTRETQRLRLGLSRRAALALIELEQIIFAEGFRTLSVDDLASRLRCSKRTLYEIGPTKVAIVRAVLAAWSERIGAAAEAAAEANETGDRLKLYLQPAIEESRSLSSAFLGDIASDPGLASFLEGHQRARVDGLRNIIEAAIDNGEFVGLNSTLLADLCLSAIQRLNSADLLARSRLSFGEAFDAFYGFLLRALETYRQASAESHDGSKR